MKVMFLQTNKQTNKQTTKINAERKPLRKETKHAI
jgi:hypothetical protein